MPSLINDTGATPLITSINANYRVWLELQLPNWVARLKAIDYEINRSVNAEGRNKSAVHALFVEAQKVGERINECHSYGIVIPTV